MRITYILQDFNEKCFPTARLNLDPTWVHRASKQQWYFRCTNMQQSTTAVPREPSIATPQKSRKVQGHSRLLAGLSNTGGSIESPMGGGAASKKHVQIIDLKCVERQ